MNQELDELLYKEYPKIFADRHLNITETCMCWGIETGNGWYEIINQLCALIQNHIDWKQKNHEWAVQWNQEHPMDPRPVPEPVAQVVAEQVKEKFGGLRFYYRGGDDVVDGMVRMAEAMSERICEECGSPGTQNSQGWIRTLCTQHAQEREQRRTETA